MIEVISKRTKIESTLNRFLEIGNVQGVAVVSKDGLLVAARLPPDVDSGVFSAMVAAMHAAGETAVKELKRGAPQIVSVESERNIVLAYSLDSIRLLVALFDSRANLGLIRYELSKTAEELRKLL